MKVFCPKGSAATHDGQEDFDEGRAGGQPIGQTAEGGRSHSGKVKEGE